MFSPEYILYSSIEIMFFIFFIISCYTTDRLNRFHQEDPDLRYGLNVAIECTVIFIGLYLGFIWKNGKVSKLQLQFCAHICPFLIITGITTLIATSKRIELAKL